LSTKGIRKDYLFFVGIILVFILFVAFFPIFDISFERQVETTKEVRKTELVFTHSISYSTPILSKHHYTFKEAELNDGDNIEFKFKLDGVVDAYIFTPNQYTSYQNGRDDQYEAVLRSKSGMLEYEVIEGGSYWFVLSNREDRDLQLSQFSCNKYWFEEVIEYEIETVTKKVSILIKLLGK
jgi:hypothetical protein